MRKEDIKVREEVDKANYTKIVESKLEEFQRVNEEKEANELVRKGDKQKFAELLEIMITKDLTWGDYLKRLVFKEMNGEKLGREVEDIGDDEVCRFIKKAFAENGMQKENSNELRGSMDPDSTTSLKDSYIKRLMEKPAWLIERETVFLFGFGLNLDDTQTETLLKSAIRESGFNFKDYKEVIYYWCLKHNEQYREVKKWLEYYEALEIEDRSGETGKKEIEKNEEYTLVFEEKTARILEREQLKEHLQWLKQNSVSKYCSKIRSEYLNEILADFWSKIPGERLDKVDKWKVDDKRKRRIVAKKFLEDLNKCPIEKVELPDNYKEILEKVLSIHKWGNRSLEKKVTERVTKIKREDILIAAFLNYSCELEGNICVGNLEKEEHKYEIIKARFMEDVNGILWDCDMRGFYLVNPLEMFLMLCLFHDRPFSFFVTVWRACTEKSDEKTNGK